MTVQGLLAKAGICINGQGPWNIQAHDEKFYSWIYALNQPRIRY